MIQRVQRNGWRLSATAFSTVVLITFSGCAIQPVPKPAPMKFCGQGETTGCQPLTPGMKELAPPRGRSEDQHDKMMFYKAPEEIWPDDFPPAPKVCGSPFTGKLIAR